MIKSLETGISVFSLQLEQGMLLKKYHATELRKANSSNDIGALKLDLDTEKEKAKLYSSFNNKQWNVLMENEVGEREESFGEKTLLAVMEGKLVNIELCSYTTQFGLEPLCAEIDG